MCRRYLTGQKNETVDENECQINASDCQTIPIVDEKVEFNLTRRPSGQATDDDERDRTQAMV